MKILTAIWQFIKKNFRWFVPAIIFFTWALIPNKTFVEALSFFAGIILMGAIWYAWTHYVNNKPIPPVI